jgi:hypothetical protein
VTAEQEEKELNLNKTTTNIAIYSLFACWKKKQTTLKSTVILFYL